MTKAPSPSSSTIISPEHATSRIAQKHACTSYTYSLNSPGTSPYSIPTLFNPLPRLIYRQNGVGAFILQCKRLDFHYCDNWGSSKGMKYVLDPP